MRRASSIGPFLFLSLSLPIYLFIFETLPPVVVVVVVAVVAAAAGAGDVAVSVQSVAELTFERMFHVLLFFSAATRVKDADVRTYSTAEAANTRQCKRCRIGSAEYADVLPATEVVVVVVVFLRRTTLTAWLVRRKIPKHRPGFPAARASGSERTHTYYY